MLILNNKRWYMIDHHVVLPETTRCYFDRVSFSCYMKRNYVDFE
jgi:hypothetical protein